MGNSCWTRAICALFFLAITLNLSKGLTHEYVVARQKRLLKDLKAPDPGQTSQQCLQDFQELLNDRGRLLPALDAAGKVESGSLLYFNWAWLGNFDQCRSIDNMQYCLALVNVKISLGYGRDVIASNGSDASSPIFLRWGVCTVDSCSDEDVANSLDDIIKAAGLSDILYVPESLVFCAKDPPMPYSTGFNAMVVVCCLLGALCVGGWFVIWHKEFVGRKDDVILLDDENTPLISGNIQRLENGQTHPNSNGSVKFISPKSELSYLQQFFKCFAINKNFTTLMSTKQSPKSIRCLHGIRVISMSWVILGHTFLWPYNTGAIDNVPKAAAWFNQFSFQAISNATVSVDSFFFLSGLLVAYLAYFEIEKRNGKLPWFKFYFHRYWRLTPVYMFVILIWIYIIPYMGQGPLWTLTLSRYNCESYWWTNMLYINNFYPTNSQTEMCIGWSWYLANDFQFYAITPLILLTTFSSELLGMIVSGSILLASFIVTATLYGYYGFSATMIGDNDAGLVVDDPGASSFNVIYVKPYTRIAPYMLGLVMGYYLYKYKDVNLNKISPTVKLMVSSLGWVLAGSVAIAVLYGLYPGSQGHVYSTFENVLYGTLARFAWSVSLAWVVFACKYGLGGYVNDILSWDFWVPLSRLTYLGYLLHPIILDILVFNIATSFHYTYNIIIFHFVAVLVLAFTSAGILYLVVESPMANLEKLIESLVTKKNK